MFLKVVFTKKELLINEIDVENVICYNVINDEEIMIFHSGHFVLTSNLIMTRVDFVTYVGTYTSRVSVYYIY